VSKQSTNHSLDELAKGLASGTLSRGKALRWMGGALLGAALASVPGVALADDCRRLGRECRRDSQCCSRNCVRRGDDKVCGCPEGKSRCGDRCVNLKRNENHCGSCGNRCAPGEECDNGECGGGEPICDPPCQEDLCARQVRRGHRHSANQYVIRPAREHVSVFSTLTVVVPSAPLHKRCLWIVAASAPPQASWRIRSVSTSRRAPAQYSPRVHRPAHNRLNRKQNFSENISGR
jgi:hypothetical protein